MNVLQFKRIQGLLVAGFGVGVMIVGGEISDAELAEIANLIGQFVTAVGGIWNLYGQAVASGPLSLKGKG